MQTKVEPVLEIDDATRLEFWMAVAPDTHLLLDAVDAPDRVLPTEFIGLYRGIVQVRTRDEPTRLQRDLFLFADGLRRAQFPFRAKAGRSAETARSDGLAVGDPIDGLGAL